MRERRELRCKVPPRFTNALAIASFTLGATSFAAQSAAGSAHQFTCAKPQCIVVHVDGISKDYPGDVYTGEVSTEANRRNVRVSDAKRTYQLTCNLENKACTTPEIDSQWQLITIRKEKPGYLDDREGEFPHNGFEVFLKASNRTLGPYWLVSDMPLLKAGAFQQLIVECRTKEQGLNENDCTRWLARRAQTLEKNCSATDTQVACDSFQGLIRASDPDLLDLFARLEHAYVCFRPHEDIFFTIWFMEPSEWLWSKADEGERKAFSLQNGMLTQIAGPGVYYYNKGVRDENADISEIGVWSYLPLTSDITPSSLARLATSNDAKFNGKTFQIDGTRISVSESYKNSNGKEIKHTLVVQRSTGRFAESYDEDPSGHTVLTYSGQCLVVPNATD